MLLPDAVSVSGGKTGSTNDEAEGGLFGGGTESAGTDQVHENPDDAISGGTSAGDDVGGNLFGGTGNGTAPTKPCSAPATSGLNLLGQVESWGIGAATCVLNVNLKVGKMSGAQLQALIKHLPDGITYGLELDKEEGN